MIPISSETMLRYHNYDITVRHGSADTVVRAMNDFNGKCYFSGSDSSETF